MDRSRASVRSIWDATQAGSCGPTASSRGNRKVFRCSSEPTCRPSDAAYSPMANSHVNRAVPSSCAWSQ